MGRVYSRALAPIGAFVANAAGIWRRAGGQMAERFHYAYQVHNVLGRDRLYMNWGLWDDETTELDSAATALVLRLGELAGLGPDSHLLDVGFGFGDQLLDWCEHQDLGSAEGLNICPEQTGVARRRLAAAGLADRVNVQVGTAMELDFPDDSFDAVTAVECAFHFPSRLGFFREARRVLEPGGRLVLADFVGSANPSLPMRVAARTASTLWRFDPSALPRVDAYEQLLRSAGFDDVQIEVVTDRVIPAGRAWARRRMWERDLRERMSRRAWMLTTGVLLASRLLRDPTPGEYILVRAVK